MFRFSRMGSNLITAGLDSKGKGNLELQPNPAKPEMNIEN